MTRVSGLAPAISRLEPGQPDRRAGERPEALAARL